MTSTCRMLVVLVAWLVIAPVALSDSPDSWRTQIHKPGYCAMYGVCGLRKDKGPLSCSNNTQAVEPTSALAEKLQAVCPTLWSEQGGENGHYCCTAEQVDRIGTDTKQALPFIVGCPACHHNFVHFWCTMVCSPDQATWTNVSRVGPADSNNVTAVLEVDYWVTESFGTQFFNSCKDVKFGAMNTPAMTFIGGGAKTYQAWFDFLGLVRDKRVPHIGSPFQQNFLPESGAPPDITPFNTPIPSCGDPAFRCSCADCPPAPGCTQAPDTPPKDDTCRMGGLRCSDWVVWVTYLVAVVVLGLVAAEKAYIRSSGFAAMFGFGQRNHLEGEPLVVGADLLTSSNSLSIHGGEDDMSPRSYGGYGTPRAYIPPVERQLQKVFYELGRINVQRGRSVAIAVGLVVLFCTLGLVRFRVETDPQKLWVGPTSQAARDRASFESSFGPFYRVEQLILTTNPTDPKDPNSRPPIMTNSTLELLFDMQDEVDALSASYTKGKMSHTATLQDICYKPFGDTCATQSVLQYWKMDREEYRKQQAQYRKPGAHTPQYCLDHWYTECRAKFDAPVDPHIVLGGYPKDATFKSYLADSTSFVVTYPVASTLENRAAAEAWETVFIHLARTRLTSMAKQGGLTLTFSSERSIQDELKRESTSDAATVLASYAVMLLYIALALGSLPRAARLRDLLVASRASVGLAGVLIVATSVVCALGLVSMVGLWSTLIIMEVIPFLVLAVGVDNMFVLAHALQRQDPTKPIDERAALALSQAGPSITLAASCEVVAFSLGALTPMPAVRNFSICAALAVAIDFALQVTIFVTLLAKDTVRLESQQPDWCFACFVPFIPWVSSPSSPSGAPRDATFGGDEDGLDSAYDPLLEDGEGEGESGKVSLQKVLQVYVERVHVPIVDSRLARGLTLLLFLTGFFWSLSVVPRIPVGLDQAVALPRDSYLQGYFRDVMAQLRVGPPLFLVVNNLNVSKASPDVNRVCSISGCDQDSLLSQVSAAAARPHTTYIATPAASWVDDFLSWLRPELSSCCRYHDEGGLGTGGQCPAPDQPPCSVNATACADCKTCFSVLPDGRPEEADVQRLLPWFLNAKPSAACAKGGAGVYTDNMQWEKKDPTGIAGLSHSLVKSSAFRTYNTPLSTQQDFIKALSYTRSFVQTLRKTLGLDVYAYSIFHVFFEQYLSIGSTALILLGCPLIAVLGVCCLLTGSFWAGGILAGVLVSLLVHLAGAMYLAGIQLNAVSLVNLAMALGIAVEFTAHITHAFCLSIGTRVLRAQAALRTMGASVLSGITLTKFVGVAVLGFAQTQIFQVYYFRLYLALVLLGAAHGLVLLPVLLALVGPPSWSPNPMQLFNLEVTPRRSTEHEGFEEGGEEGVDTPGH